MGRLTKVDGIGQNEIIKCFDCDLEKAGAELEHCGYCEHWQAVVDRLAAYEDTGLEPEEIKDILDRYLGFRSAISDETGQPMVSWTRASELVRADKNGRLVVLPCKVGETLYTESPIRGMVTSFKAPDLAWIIENISEFGKTVFLTRAEAEAEVALGGGGDG